MSTGRGFVITALECTIITLLIVYLIAYDVYQVDNLRTLCAPNVMMPLKRKKIPNIRPNVAHHTLTISHSSLS